jgi:hypothetical protein
MDKVQKYNSFNTDTGSVDMEVFPTPDDHTNVILSPVSCVKIMEVFIPIENQL